MVFRMVTTVVDGVEYLWLVVGVVVVVVVGGEGGGGRGGGMVGSILVE